MLKAEGSEGGEGVSMAERTNLRKFQKDYGILGGTNLLLYAHLKFACYLVK